jgi:class 3 adenylate cyclase
MAGANNGTTTNTTGMPAGVTTALASVVFLKMHEFARRPVTEQTRLRAQLEAVVAVTAAELEPHSRVVLDAADGAVVVILRDPIGALRLAERALFAAAAGLPLSVGINHGAVQLAGAGKGDEGLAGDGIAVAANVAEFAGPSALLISRAFRDALADLQPGLEAQMLPAGTFTDSGLRTHELFAPDHRVPRRRRRKYVAASLAAVILLVGAGVGVRIAAEGQDKFLDGVAAKYRDTAAQGRSYVEALVQKVKF